MSALRLAALARVVFQSTDRLGHLNGHNIHLTRVVSRHQRRSVTGHRLSVFNSELVPDAGGDIVPQPMGSPTRDFQLLASPHNRGPVGVATNAKQFGVGISLQVPSQNQLRLRPERQPASLAAMLCFVLAESCRPNLARPINHAARQQQQLTGPRTARQLQVDQVSALSGHNLANCINMFLRNGLPLEMVRGFRSTDQ